MEHVSILVDNGVEIRCVQLFTTGDDLVRLPIRIIECLAKMVDIPQINLITAFRGTQRIAVVRVPSWISDELHHFREACPDEVGTARHLIKGVETDVLQDACHANGIFILCRHENIVHINLVVFPTITHFNIITLHKVLFEPAVKIVLRCLRVNDDTDIAVYFIVRAGYEAKDDAKGADDIENIFCFHIVTIFE